jgi:DNA-binding NarL/FixJ family response regulator
LAAALPVEPIFLELKHTPQEYCEKWIAYLIQLNRDGLADLMTRSALRILVVDDNEAVRRGICQLLESQADIEIVCQASDGADAVQKAREHRPDIVLLDITMPAMNGFEVTRIIRQELPSTQILIVSQHESTIHEKDAFAAGASGYVVKSDAARDLLPAVRRLQSQGRRAESEKAPGTSLE